MSIQLVLYPQNHDGVYTTTSFPVLREYVSDGKFFNSLNFLSGYDAPTTSTNPAFDALTFSPAIASWKKFRSTNTSGIYGITTMPSQSFLNRLVINSSSSNLSSSGVYQKIQNLYVGVQYELNINITQAGAGGILIIGNSLSTNTIGGGLVTQLSTSATGTQTILFTAANTTETLILDYRNSNGTTIRINKISIKDKVNAPSQTYGELSDGQVICDTYEEEDIPLTLSIDNFKNVAEKVQSYSKDFNLPATKRNNKIFTHLFEVTKTQDGLSFNPYVKTECILKQDGYTIFQGFLKLIDIVNKEEEISYNVNLYSEPIALKDILENKKFRDLDFSELEHDYNKTNIKASWYDSTGITLNTPLSTDSNAYNATLGVNNTDVLKYPFVNWVGDFELDANNNIILASLEDAFRPFINCKYILDQIFRDTNIFTYTSEFLNTSRFTDLFMDFNWGEGNAPNDIVHLGEASLSTDDNIVNTFTPLNFDATTFTTDFGFDLSTDIFTCTADNTIYQFNYGARFVWSDVSSALQVRWLKTSGGVTTVINLQGTLVTSGSLPFQYLYQGTINVTLDDGDTLQFQAVSTVSSGIKCTSALITGSVTFTTMTNSILLNTLRGDLGQWEYLKGFFNMFNLVVLQDKNNPNNLIIEPYNDIFIKNTSGTSLASRNILYDWTDKIDVTEIKLSPLELVKKTIFKYVDDDGDYPRNLYKNTTNKDYGSYSYPSSLTPDLTLLTGEEEILATPFASTVVKPIADYLGEFIVPVIYSSNEDNTEFESFNNKPRILYKVSASPFTLSGSVTYKIPTQNSVSGEDAEDYLRFSHTSALPSTIDDSDLNYGEIQLIGTVGDSPVDNLYNTYWSPYYDELYNSDTRYMTLKVNLNAADINQFNFFDQVMIKNRNYRVNKIEYKPNDLSTVEFILIP